MTSQNPVHTYAVTGTYTVCLTITTASGCTDTWCSSVDAQSRCMPQFFAYPDSTMPGTPTMVYQIYSPATAFGHLLGTRRRHHGFFRHP